jgi:hypothetical protein
MELSDDAPKFPKLPFLLGDAALIGVAIYVAVASGSPLPPAAIYTIAGCVALGALLGVLPFIVNYNRRQETLLTERQGALEALARTTSSAVEQASIAANGLHQIVELAQKNLRIADQLPQKLHERINEFSRAQDEALVAELESLQQEVNTLRASEAEKLEAAADKIQRTATEFAKVEAGLRQQVHALETAAQSTEKTIASSTAAALVELEKKIAAVHAALASAAVPRPPAGEHTNEHERRPAPRRVAHADPEPARLKEPTVAGPPEAPALSPPAHSPAPVGATVDRALASPPAVAGAAGPTDTPPASAAANLASAPVAAPAPAAARKAAPKRRAADHESFLPGMLDEAVPAARTEAIHASATHTTRAKEADETAQLAPDEVTPEPALSSDGVTRLIVTAYIGIGNRLFIRGEGPGLSWDRGVPLQFVSIGKWRWETADAHQPVAVKLYKNDEIECTAVGEILLKAGHQREVTATF